MGNKSLWKSWASIMGIFGYLLGGLTSLVALNPGDVALTRVTPDSVILLALADIPAGERIIFTDRRWTSRGFEPDNGQEGEGFYVWTAPANGDRVEAGAQVRINFPSGTIFLDWQDYLFLFQITQKNPQFLYSIFTDRNWNLWDNPARGLTNDITSISIGIIADAPTDTNGQPRINHEIKSDIRETFKGELDQLGLLRKLAEIQSWTWVENNPNPIDDGDFANIPSSGLIEFSSPFHLVREDATSFSVILRRLYGSKENVSVRLSTVTRISDFARFRPRATGVFDDLTGVAYGNGIFTVVGSGSETLTSTNGITWNQPHPIQFENLHGVAFGAGQFIAVGKDGLILTSTDGASWTEQASPTVENLYSVEFLNNIFFAVGEKNTILTSIDTVTWNTATISSESGALYGINFGNNLFVAVGKDGALFSSEDGETWLPTGVGVTGKTLWEIVYTNTGFVAVGDEGRIVFSGDGATWAQKRSGERLSLYAVAVVGANKVAVGKEGLIITTDDSAASQALETLDDDTDFQSTREESRASSLFDVAFAADTVVAVGEYGKIISGAITGGTQLSAAAETDFTSIVNASVFWADGDSDPKVQTITFARDNVTAVRKRFDLRLISALGEPDLGTSTTHISIFNSDPPFNRIVDNYGPFLTFKNVELSLNNGDSTLAHQLRFRIQNTSSVDSKALLVTFDGSNLPDLDLPIVPSGNVSEIIQIDLPEVVQSISLFEFLSNNSEPVFKHRRFINSVFIVEDRSGNGVKAGTLGTGFVTDLVATPIGVLGSKSSQKENAGGVGVIKPLFSGGTPPPPPGEGGGEGFGLVLTEIELTGNSSIETGSGVDFTAIGTYLDPFTQEEFEEELTDPQPDWILNPLSYPLDANGLLTANANPTLVYPQTAALSASSIDGAPVDELGNPIPVITDLNVEIDEPAGNQDYPAWVTTNGLLAGPSGEKDDFDGDERANLLEFSLGTDPTVDDPQGLPYNMVDKGGGTYSIQYTRPKSRRGVIYKLQKSTDFHSWSDLGQTLFSQDSTTETWESSGTEDSPANFRLVIERFDQ